MGRLIVAGLFLIQSFAFCRASTTPQYFSFGSGNDIRDFVFEGDSVLWVATSNGVYKWMLNEKGYYRITREDGSPNSDITAVARDSSGVYWFGTKKGINTFDGEKWDVYSEKGFDEAFVADDIEVDGYGRVYFLSPTQIAGYTGRHGFILTNPIADDIYDRNGFNNAKCLQVTAEGSMLIGTGEGLFVRDSTSTNYVSNYSGQIYSLDVDKQGVIWCGTDDGLMKYDSAGWGKIPEPLTDEINLQDSLTAVALDSRGKIWMPGTRGAVCYDGVSWKETAFPEGFLPSGVSRISEGLSGKIWFGTQQGLLDLEEDGGWEALTVENSTDLSPPGNLVGGWTVDNDPGWESEEDYWENKIISMVRSGRMGDDWFTHYAIRGDAWIDGSFYVEVEAGFSKKAYPWVIEGEILDSTVGRRNFAFGIMKDRDNALLAAFSRDKGELNGILRIVDGKEHWLYRPLSGRGIGLDTHLRQSYRMERTQDGVITVKAKKSSIWEEEIIYQSLDTTSAAPVDSGVLVVCTRGPVGLEIRKYAYGSSGGTAPEWSGLPIKSDFQLDPIGYQGVDLISTDCEVWANLETTVKVIDPDYGVSRGFFGTTQEDYCSVGRPCYWSAAGGQLSVMFYTFGAQATIEGLFRFVDPGDVPGVPVIYLTFDGGQIDESMGTEEGGLIVEQSGNQGKCTLRFEGLGGIRHELPVELELERWYHLAWVRNGTDHAIFVDGEPVVGFQIDRWGSAALENVQLTVGQSGDHAWVRRVDKEFLHLERLRSTSRALEPGEFLPTHLILRYPPHPVEEPVSTDPRLKFRYATANERLSTPAVGLDGTVYFISGCGNALDAIDPEGNFLWRYDAGENIRNPIVGPQGEIYVTGSKMISVSPDGTLLSDEIAGRNYINFSPLIESEGTYYSSEGRLLALNYTSGEIKWELDLRDSRDDYENTIYNAGAIGPDGTVYVVTKNMRLLAVTPDGKMKWEFYTGKDYFDDICIYNFNLPVVGQDGTVYIGLMEPSQCYYESHLYAINPYGVVKWKYKSPESVISTAMVGADGTIYFGAHPAGCCDVMPCYPPECDSYFIALYPDGTLKWQFIAHYRITSHPIMDDNGTIYFNTEGGIFWALDSGTGEGLAEGGWPRVGQNARGWARIDSLSSEYKLPCDINGDSRLDIADLIKLLLLGRDNPENPDLDWNADGQYSTADVISLLKDILDGACPEARGGLQLAASGAADWLSAEDREYLRDLLGGGDLDSTLTALLDRELSITARETGLPRAFSLAQNFPNPFNPATTITYEIPVGNPVWVTLKIFNTRGALVRTLVDSERSSGTHTAFWDGTDGAGRRVPSGVYFYRIEAGNFSKTRKMVLLK